MNKLKDQIKRKRLEGEVVSDKMDKSVVVSISRLKKHPKYLKRYYRHKNIIADDPKSEYKTGDMVIIEEVRPISKRKRFRVVSKLEEKKK